MGCQGSKYQVPTLRLSAADLARIASLLGAVLSTCIDMNDVSFLERCINLVLRGFAMTRRKETSEDSRAV